MARAIFPALLAMLALVIAGCQSAPVPRQDLRAGTAQTAVVKLLGRAPDKKSEFALPDQPGVKYKVLEYYLAPRKNEPEQRHWFLFSGDALIGFGLGGEKEAKTLALDTYYGWLADHEQLRRAEAERRLLARIRDVYGKDLNPRVVEYFELRIKTIEGDEGRRLTAEATEVLIAEKLAETRQFNHPGQSNGRSTESSRRYAALVDMGLDLQSSRARHRPRAGTARRSLRCSQATAAGGATVGCL